MNGYEALKILKNDPEINDIPVIAVSANGMQKDIDKALNHGVRGLYHQAHRRGSIPEKTASAPQSIHTGLNKIPINKKIPISVPPCRRSQYR